MIVKLILGNFRVNRHSYSLIKIFIFSLKSIWSRIHTESPFLTTWSLLLENTVDSLYLEYLSISNKMFGHLKFPPKTLRSLSLSRTFPYIKPISGPLNHFLSLSRTFTYSSFIFEFPNKFEFESKQKFRP